MKCAISRIEVDCTFTVTRREVELLHFITSYNNQKFVEAMESKAYEAATKKELVDLMNNLQEVTGSLMHKYKQVALFKG